MCKILRVNLNEGKLSTFMINAIVNKLWGLVQNWITKSSPKGIGDLSSKDKVLIIIKCARKWG